MTLLNSIKESEGFRGEVYKDTLGFDTIGYGTKLPLNKKEAELILQYRLSIKIKELTDKKPFVIQLSQARQDVLYEMAYQLGANGLLKFKKMWEALDNRDYYKASIEMLDSKWSSQTPSRAKKLSEIMNNGN